MDHEMEKIMRRLNQLVKENNFKITMKNPNSDGMIAMGFARTDPERIRFNYDQVTHALENVKKQREEFEKRVKLDTESFKIEIQRLENQEKELKPHFERVKLPEEVKEEAKE